jgi:hypothetical protein
MYDRRRHQRYLLDKSCFLTNSASVGTIIDISMGGLSCMCLEGRKCGQDSPKKGIYIFCKKATMLAQGLPVKVLDSIIVPGKFDKGLNFRKCHVKFEQLEHVQKNYVQEIILSYATLSIK